MALQNNDATRALIFKSDLLTRMDEPNIQHNTGLPKYPSTKEDLLNISNPSNFCFIQAIDFDAINAETSNQSPYAQITANDILFRFCIGQFICFNICGVVLKYLLLVLWLV